MNDKLFTNKNSNHFQLSENFNLKEFECRHCNQVKLSPELVNKLQSLRTALNKPLIILSGFRCREHNTNIGGAQRSQHLEGTAADISLHTISLNVKELSEIVSDLDFHGIGLYDSFIHLDVREIPAFWDLRRKE